VPTDSSGLPGDAGGPLDTASGAAPPADPSTRRSAPPPATIVTFSASRYEVSGSAPAARVVVRRVGNSRDELPFVWWTEAASAKPDIDYAALGPRVELIPRGKQNVTIFVPIISNPLRQQSTQFYVALGAAGASSVPSTRVIVTIGPRG